MNENEKIQVDLQVKPTKSTVSRLQQYMLATTKTKEKEESKDVKLQRMV